MGFRFYLIVAVVIMNLLTFAMYGIDKQKAKRNKWRIPEATLIGMAFLFGGVGAFLGMRVFRHKTKHIKFMVLVPLAMILEMVLLIFFLYN